MNENLPPTFVKGFHDEEVVRKMKYVPFGNTGMVVSIIGLGGACFSSFFGECDEEEAIATIHQALKSGINYIDTAPYYGQRSSETILGKALKTVPRQAYYIATKIGRYGPMTFDYSSQRTVDSVTHSLELLGLSSIDIIQVHDIEFADTLETVLNECLPTLEKHVIKTGKAKFIGVTGYPILVLKECIEKSRVKISSVISYCRFTLVDDTLSEYLQFFKDNDVVVINASTLQMGLLSNNGPPSWHPADDSTKQICKEAVTYCKDRGVELGQLAFNHALTKTPGPTIHLVGMNNRNILKSNLEVVYNGLDAKQQEILKEINQKFFSKLKYRHWEGVELKAYREARNNQLK